MGRAKVAQPSALKKPCITRVNTRLPHGAGAAGTAR
jgi:hypothetical protein